MKAQHQLQAFPRTVSLVKGSILFLLLTIIVIIPSFGQQSGGRPAGGGGRGGATPEMRAQRQTDMMKEELKLTAAQEPKVADINLKYAKKVDEARKNTDTTAVRKAVLTLQDQKNKEMKLVLNATQYKDYLKMVEEMKKRMMNRPPR